MIDTETPDAELDENLAFAVVQVMNALYAVARNASAQRRARLMQIVMLLNEVVEAGAYEEPKGMN